MTENSLVELLLSSDVKIRAFSEPTRPPLELDRNDLWSCITGDKTLSLDKSDPLSKLLGVLGALHTKTTHFLHSDLWRSELTTAPDKDHFESSYTYDERCLVMMTSGTSGQPKPVCISREQILHQILAARTHLDIQKGDRVLVHLDLSHSGGLLMLALPALAAGAEILLVPPRKNSLFTRALIEFNPSHFIFRPMEYRVATFNGSIAEALRKAKSVVTGSYAIPQWFISELVSHRVPLWNVFGATEFGPFAFSQKFSSPEEPALVGEPSKGIEFKISPEGELLVRGALVSPGYLHQPERQGAQWFHTEDLVDGSPPQGRFLGKKKRLLNRQGLSVNPALAEKWIIDQLERMGYQCEALMKDVLDDRGYSTPTLFIAISGSIKDEEKHILKVNFMRHFPKALWPQIWQWDSTLPRNPNGKPDLT